MSSGGALREIIARFTIDAEGAKKSLDALHQKIGQGTKVLGEMANAFIDSKMVEGFTEFIGNMIEVGASTADAAERLGISTDLFQRLGFAASQSGASLEAVTTGIQFLNRNLGQVAEGVSSAEDPFRRLGVNVKDASGRLRTVQDLLPDLAEGFANLKTPQEQTAAAMNIFGRGGAALVPLLKDGAEGIQQLNKDFDELGGGMSKDFVSSSKEAEDQFDRLKLGARNFTSQLVMAAMPTIKKYTGVAINLMKAFLKLSHETKIAKEIMAVFAAGAALAGLKAAGSFAKLFGLVPEGAGFFKTLMGMGKFIAIAAVALVVLLAFEDLFTFLEGGDSVTGQLIDHFYGVGKAAQVAHDIKLAFLDLFQFLKSDQAQSAASTLIDAFESASRAFLDILVAIGHQVGNLWKIMTDTAHGNFSKVADDMGATLKDQMKDIKGFWGDLSGKNNIALSTIDSLAHPAIPTVNVNDLPKSSSSKVSQTNHFKIDVHGGNTNAETGKSIVDAVVGALGQSDLNNAFNSIPVQSPNER